MQRLRVRCVKLSDTGGGTNKANPDPAPRPTTYAEPFESSRGKAEKAALRAESRFWCRFWCFVL